MVLRFMEHMDPLADMKENMNLPEYRSSAMQSIVRKPPCSGANSYEVVHDANGAMEKCHSFPALYGKVVLCVLSNHTRSLVSRCASY